MFWAFLTNGLATRAWDHREKVPTAAGTSVTLCFCGPFRRPSMRLMVCPLYNCWVCLRRCFIAFRCSVSLAPDDLITVLTTVSLEIIGEKIRLRLTMWEGLSVLIENIYVFIKNEVFRFTLLFSHIVSENNIFMCLFLHSRSTQKRQKKASNITIPACFPAWSTFK